MGTQKNRLNETVLLSTQNILKFEWVKKYLQFYTEKICLSKPVDAHDTHTGAGPFKYEVCGKGSHRRDL